jgi:hypothetical protein
MHENVPNNKHYPKAQEFIDAVNTFLQKTIPEIKDIILSRYTDNLQRLLTSF